MQKPTLMTIRNQKISKLLWKSTISSKCSFKKKTAYPNSFLTYRFHNSYTVHACVHVHLPNAGCTPKPVHSEHDKGWNRRDWSCWTRSRRGRDRNQWDCGRSWSVWSRLKRLEQESRSGTQRTQRDWGWSRNWWDCRGGGNWSGNRNKGTSLDKPEPELRLRRWRHCWPQQTRCFAVHHADTMEWTWEPQHWQKGWHIVDHHGSRMGRIIDHLASTLLQEYNGVMGRAMTLAAM